MMAAPTTPSHPSTFSKLLSKLRTPTSSSSSPNNTLKQTYSTPSLFSKSSASLASTSSNTSYHPPTHANNSLLSLASTSSDAPASGREASPSGDEESWDSDLALPKFESGNWLSDDFLATKALKTPAAATRTFTSASAASVSSVAVGSLSKSTGATASGGVGTGSLGRSGGLISRSSLENENAGAGAGSGGAGTGTGQLKKGWMSRSKEALSLSRSTGASSASGTAVLGESTNGQQMMMSGADDVTSKAEDFKSPHPSTQTLTSLSSSTSHPSDVTPSFARLPRRAPLRPSTIGTGIRARRVPRVTVPEAEVIGGGGSEESGGGTPDPATSNPSPPSTASPEPSYYPFPSSSSSSSTTTPHSSSSPHSFTQPSSTSPARPPLSTHSASPNSHFRSRSELPPKSPKMVHDDESKRSQAVTTNFVSDRERREEDGREEKKIKPLSSAVLRQRMLFTTTSATTTMTTNSSGSSLASATGFMTVAAEELVEVDHHTRPSSRASSNRPSLEGGRQPLSSNSTSTGTGSGRPSLDSIRRTATTGTESRRTSPLELGSASSISGVGGGGGRSANGLVRKGSLVGLAGVGVAGGRTTGSLGRKPSTDLGSRIVSGSGTGSGRPSLDLPTSTSTSSMSIEARRAIVVAETQAMLGSTSTSTIVADRDRGERESMMRPYSDVEKPKPSPPSSQPMMVQDENSYPSTTRSSSSTVKGLGNSRAPLQPLSTSSSSSSISSDKTIRQHQQENPPPSSSMRDPQLPLSRDPQPQPQLQQRRPLASLPAHDYRAPLPPAAPRDRVQPQPLQQQQQYGQVYENGAGGGGGQYYQQPQQQQQQMQQALMPPPDAPLPPKPVKKTPAAIVVNGKTYYRAGILGRGGSSRVYRVLDSSNNLYAVKKVDISKNDAETRASFINEIQLLEKLRGRDQIIRLVDAEIDERKRTLFMVMEVGETDLNNLLVDQIGKPISMNFIRYIWEQMLDAVSVIHSLNVVHTDLKPANFVLVKGRLKLIDFGISKAIANDTTNIGRDQQIGTANYMPPEALMDSGLGLGGRRLMKLGRAADVWSLGCILHQMIYGRTPFAHIRDVGQKIMAIQNPRYIIHLPDYSCPVDERGEEKVELKVRVGEEAKDAIRGCLRWEAKGRLGIPELLDGEFLKSGSEREREREKKEESGMKVDERLMAALVQRAAETFTGRMVSDDEKRSLAAKWMEELRAAQS